MPYRAQSPHPFRIQQSSQLLITSAPYSAYVSALATGQEPSTQATPTYSPHILSVLLKRPPPRLPFFAQPLTENVGCMIFPTATPFTAYMHVVITMLAHDHSISGKEICKFHIRHAPDHVTISYLRLLILLRPVHLPCTSAHFFDLLTGKTPQILKIWIPCKRHC